MLKQTMAAALLAIFAVPAMAGSCPTLMNDVDSMLGDEAVVSGLGDAELERVRDLRAKGEDLHNSGSHAESVATLQEAIEILEGAGGASDSGSGSSY